ncbi:hypothetical protein, conserved [Trypanosoma brucei gambiense DAL972]|uniref:Uncharacterized protein n=1 Tax=Trypanosoma brucei gambiense (strain MHOM/CI/86/DAL972) TaxID=679716 RepID=C9ZJ11_TRYB9|nr:hypothetical protein, conserved [Trypanosoma brucei gambiense DAL972]CBH09369.1 hypothetical protein, conserved [Trypanosoma brucei gambiense DAL972]|eukprot:XP_011771675.1 hypothetical protein, conserved [Trypanosoma brucei gambiense DAL972]
MRSETRRRGRRCITVPMYMVLPALVMLTFLLWNNMSREHENRMRGGHIGEGSHAVRGGLPGVENLRASPAVFSFTTKLLSVLTAFVDQETDGMPASVAAAGGATDMFGLPPNATPAAILLEYYETQLPKFNNELEKRLDNGSIKNVTHSDTYWSPTHVARRGYGLEGSIFVGLLHHETPLVRMRRSVSLESVCAMTVHNLYESALWSVAIFTGIVEFLPDVMTAEESGGRGGHNSSRWPFPPSSPCIPAAYQSHTCAERYGFCPRDNIRLRQLRVSAKSRRHGKGSNMGGGEGNVKVSEKKENPRSRRAEDDYEHAGYRDGDASSGSDASGGPSDFTSIASQRYATLALYRGETYVMFLNAGVLLVPSWDVTARLMLLRLPSRRPILSQMANIIQRDVVHRAWEEVVVRHVSNEGHRHEGVKDHGDQQFRDDQRGKERGGTEDYFNVAHERNPSKKRSGSTLYDLEGLRLHSSDGMEDKEKGDGNGESAAEGARGFGSEDVVEFLFRLPTEEDGGEATSGAEPLNYPRNGASIPNVRTRMPNSAQLYWMKKLREPLRKKLLTSMSEQNTTSYVCGVAVKMQHSEEGCRKVCDAKSDGGSSGCGNVENGEDVSAAVSGGEGAKFKLRYESRRRLTYVLRDRRYMEPLPIHWCNEKNDAVCLGSRRQESFPSSLSQPWLSTDFLFTRAGAFFDFSHDAADHQNSHNNSSSGNAGNHVPLDPYMGFLTPDEEAVLLAGRLWTHGWDFYAPTEPIAFAAAVHAEGAGNGTSGNNKVANMSSKVRDARLRGLVRLNFVLFGQSNAARGLRSDGEAALKHVEKYGLGSRRSRESFLQHVGLRSSRSGRMICTQEDDFDCVQKNAKNPWKWYHCGEVCSGL